MNDIEYLDDIMNINKNQKLFDKCFFWLYPFTNENISGYYSNIDFKDKDVLTVTSSGDHALNAFLMGARNIDTFDINPLAKYYSELKIASIKSLSLEEFFLFLYNKRLLGTSKYFLKKSLYNKVRENLDSNYLDFWDYVFNKYSNKDIIKSKLFTKDFLYLKELTKSNMYLNKDTYYKLRDILFKKSINYIDCDIKKLSKLNKKYDVIILSNIPDYFDIVYKSDKEALIELRNILNSIKKNNTKIVLCYLYGCINDSNYKYGIYNKELVNEYFTGIDYKYEYFIGAVDLAKSLTLAKMSDYRDGVIVSR